MTATLDHPLPVIECRCLWCRDRIGVARYRVNGVWQELPGAEIVSDLSDGICPVCKEICLENLKTKQL